MYKGRWYTASQLLSTRQGWAQHVPLAKDLTNTTSKKKAGSSEASSHNVEHWWGIEHQPGRSLCCGCKTINNVLM